MASSRAPKQWCLTKTETVNTFENWKQNLTYTLSLDKNFAPFLVSGTKWEKKTRNSPHRGFENDGEEVEEALRHTREQKVSMLELMLGQIANYCPIISRNTIVKNSTSIDSIWQTIRLHYGFQSTGAHFIDFDSIRYEPGERPEDLYQRLNAFIEDNLLRKDMGITHNDETIDEDEELSPTVENLVVLTWLRLINPDLPKLVKQRYGTELRTRTLASIKPEISQALDSLLDELRNSDDAKAMRAAVQRLPNSKHSATSARSSNQKSCPLCKTAGRPDKHFLSKCMYLPANDRRFLAKARVISDITDHDSDNDDAFETDSVVHSLNTVSSKRVQICQSPYLDTYNGHIPMRLTIDSGATGNMIRASTAALLNAKITKSSQSARQADGSSPLSIVGETRLTFTRDNHTLYFEGLVVENLDSDVLAGIPFMEKNDVATRPSRKQVTIGDTSVYTYGTSNDKSTSHAIRRAHIARATTETTLWPGDFIDIDLPADMSSPDDMYCVEPHMNSKFNESWPKPTLLYSVNHSVRIPNLTDEPLVLKRNDHLCQIRATYVPSSGSTSNLVTKTSPNSISQLHSDIVRVDPDSILTSEMRGEFKTLVKTYDNVFDPKFKGYNGAAGPLEAKVNMGPVQPPQRKGRIPQYSKNQLDILQDKFDELEEIGVFKRPEDIDINVEYLNPSFLVKKPSGGFRLVTAFADVGRYSKPQPTLMPDVDSTLRQIAQWKYIAITDLTKSFYQIPLAKDSMKYCGVATPFKGVRVYARSAMGMPGSETVLEELTCRVLGHLVQEGIVAKIADDLYCGGSTPSELHSNFERVLQALNDCNLNLSASKTIIAPKQATILGWIWESGTLRASPHRIATLASCQPPKTVTAMRSFIGAYKVLSRVIKNTSNLLSPLENAIAGNDSKDNISWDDDLTAVFNNAQKALVTSKSITLPRSEDQLWIVTDGALRKGGLGATLYVNRDNKLILGGFFSAKLRQNQQKWLPCEIEALSIAAAIKHFSPYIIQAKSSTCVLTDNKPCVQAYEKLCRGEFSSSPRVLTFLSTASRFQVSIRHVSGASILPSDFASRNAPDCNNPDCQVCNFIHRCEEATVSHVTTTDILEGKAHLPFTSRSAWISLQAECSDIRRTIAHLRQGTRPSKKLTNVKDVKRYLGVTSLSKDGLLIAEKKLAFAPHRERIVVPRQVLDGLLTSIHIKLDHPSTHQMKTVVSRYFFALDMDKAIECVTQGCHQCAALLKTRKFREEQTTTDPPETIGSSYAADILKRERQLIFVIRECVTSYTFTKLIDTERHQDLRDALLQLLAEVHPLEGPFAVVRTDCAPGFKSLLKDDILTRHRISIELGRPKNVNKNPVAEKAIQELEDEIRRSDPSNGILTPLALSLVTARLNTRIRNRGLSAREMWMQRDQFSNDQLPISDRDLINSQHEIRTKNHFSSEKSKCHSNVTPEIKKLDVGDIVYLRCDFNKTKSRDRYLVTSVDEPWCNIRKFVGAQLRKASYRVKCSDCYKVPVAYELSSLPNYVQTDISHSDEDDVDSNTIHKTSPPELPQIPQAISTPPDPIPENFETAHDVEGQSQPEPIQEFDDVESSHDISSAETLRPVRSRSRPKKFDDYVMY